MSNQVLTIVVRQPYSAGDVTISLQYTTDGVAVKPLWRRRRSSQGKTIDTRLVARLQQGLLVDLQGWLANQDLW